MRWRHVRFLSFDSLQMRNLVLRSQRKELNKKKKPSMEESLMSSIKWPSPETVSSFSCAQRPLSLSIVCLPLMGIHCALSHLKRLCARSHRGCSVPFSASALSLLLFDCKSVSYQQYVSFHRGVPLISINRLFPRVTDHGNIWLLACWVVMPFLSCFQVQSSNNIACPKYSSTFLLLLPFQLSRSILLTTQVPWQFWGFLK